MKYSRNFSSKAIAVVLVFVMVGTSFSFVSSAAGVYDIDRGDDTGVNGWDKVTQYFNNVFYGSGKVSFDVSNKRKEFHSVGVQVADVLVNMDSDDVAKLNYDFPDAKVDFVSDVSDGLSLYSVEIGVDEVVGGFWDGFLSMLGCSVSPTLANSDYVSNVYLNHLFSLDLPSEVVGVKDRLSIIRYNEVGITTQELRDFYGIDDVGYSGLGIKVAVLDTGIYLNNTYNSYNSGVNESNFFGLSGVIGDNSTVDYCGHGSHVCSILAGANVTIDGYDFQGMAPDATVYSIRVLNSKGVGYERDIVNGLQMAIDLDVDIISMSIGGNLPAFSALYDTVQRARADGIIIIAAAGNEKAYISSSPALWDGVISVGCLTKDGFISFFSNLNFDVAAIGQGVTAPAYSRNDGIYTWVTMSGTSMSCPLVAGIVADYLEKYPKLKGKGSVIVQDMRDNGEYANPEVPDNLFSVLTWMNDYYYDFPEISVERLFEDTGSVVVSRSSRMTFYSINTWRALGKNP